MSDRPTDGQRLIVLRAASRGPSPAARRRPCACDGRGV